MYSGFWIHQNPSLALMTLAAVLRDKHDVKVVDAEALKLNWMDVKGVIRNMAPDVLGVSCTTLTFRGMVKTVKLAKLAYPNIHVMIGGAHVSSQPHKSLALTGADCAVVGEGELTVESALTHCGVLYNSKPADLDTLPYPARDLFTPRVDSEWYVGNDPIIQNPETTVIWQRGCPHRCSFCTHSVFGQVNRRRSPENIVKELQQIKDNYNVKTIFVYDDEAFGMNRSETKWLTEVCRNIVDGGVNGFKYKTQARCHRKYVTDEMLSAMREAGFEAVMLGCESGSQKVLDAINKHLTIEDIKFTVKKCKDHGFKVYTYWMIGNKTETVEDAKKTLALMRELAEYIDARRVAILNPLPGSDIYGEAMRNGWITNYNFSHWIQGGCTVMHGPWMREEDILDWEQKLLA